MHRNPPGPRTSAGARHRQEVRALPYRVTLRFRADGPAVTGEWAEQETADRRYRSYVGLYGSLPAVTIRLDQLAGGHVQVLKEWPPNEGAKVEPQ
jgi:hypothetical protein